MELTDLDKDERLALMALLRATVLADHRVSDDERDRLDEVVEAWGEAHYREMLDAVDQTFADEDAVRTFLQTIRRQEARELIYGTVLDLAMSDTIVGNESPLLGWLGPTWNVESSIVPSPDDE